MDSSEMESDAQILGLSEDEHGNQNISYEVDPVLGTKRLHLDSESSVDIEVGNFGGFMMDKRIKLENNSEDENEGTSGLMRTGCEDLGDDPGIMLGSTPPEVMASSSSDLVFNNETENSDDDACILIHHMDIKEPLANLKKALEETHSINLDGYEFYLQDTTLSTVVLQDDPGFQYFYPTDPEPQDLFELLPIELTSESFLDDPGFPCWYTGPIPQDLSLYELLAIELTSKFFLVCFLTYTFYTLPVNVITFFVFVFFLLLLQLL
ncbi:hypothetical protein J6590_039029 [Homalodisca vitripennis]|nr:hypothetical protein J6590_039029 [Homalodisca vitripennis]